MGLNLVTSVYFRYFLYAYKSEKNAISIKLKFGSEVYCMGRRSQLRKAFRRPT